MTRRKYPDYVYAAAKLVGMTPKRFYESLHRLSNQKGPSWADLAKHAKTRADPSVTKPQRSAREEAFGHLFDRICALADPKRWERYEQPWSLRMRALPKELSELAALAEKLAEKYELADPPPLTVKESWELFREVEEKKKAAAKPAKKRAPKKSAKKRAPKKSARRRKGG